MFTLLESFFAVMFRYTLYSVDSLSGEKQIAHFSRAPTFVCFSRQWKVEGRSELEVNENERASAGFGFATESLVELKS